MSVSWVSEFVQQPAMLLLFLTFASVSTVLSASPSGVKAAITQKLLDKALATGLPAALNFLK